MNLPRRALLLVLILVSGSAAESFGQARTPAAPRSTAPTRPLGSARATGQAGPFGARIRPPRPNPTVSPYLALLNQANEPAVNYYSIYRPQRRTLDAIQSLNTDVNRIDRDLKERAAAPPSVQEYRLGPTGHPTGFMSYGNYFPNQGR